MDEPRTPLPRSPQSPQSTIEDETRAHRVERFLPRFSLTRRVTVLVLLASALVVGAVTTQLIPLGLLPEGIEGSFLSIYAPWQDAPPRETMDKIVLPLEEELATVRGIDRITSRATSGSGRVWLRFKQGTDMDVAYREVRDRVQRARLRMPDDVEQVFIRKDDASGIPVVVLGLALDPDLTDPYNLIEYQVIRPLERIDGVASVGIEGLQEKEILIELDRSRTEASGLNIYQLAQELGGDNFSMASGHVTSGGKKLLLRSVARYGSLEELENRPVAPNIRLKDIGTVAYVAPERRFSVRANSKPAYALSIVKEGQANTIDLAERIRAEVERMKQDPRLAGIEMITIFDQGDVILESLDTLIDSGKIGAFFAIGVLFFFLRRFRMTLIITLSIPLSILIALAVMYFMGETLNILTLLGLMISVGLLVDNSVVVAENIFRLHREGLARREACVRGAGEMALAITMATLTTVAVFLPVSLIEGEAQVFLQRLSIPISVSLLGSLFVALVFIPLSVYLTLPAAARRTRDEQSRFARLGKGFHTLVDGTFHRAYEATFGRLNRGYTRLLAASLGRRFDVVLVTLVLFAVTISLFANEAVRIVPMQEDERGGFELDVELPDSTTLEESEAYLREGEKVLAEMADELGLDGWLVVAWSTGGELQGWFQTPKTVDVTPREAAERLRDALPERAGVEFYLGAEDETSDDETTSTQAYTLVGEDPDQLEATAEDVEALFVSVEGVLGLQKSGDDEAPNEVALVVDRDRAQSQGVDPSALAGMVGYALRGQALPRYSQEGREVPVRIRFAEEDRESLAELQDFAVPTEGGGFVPISAVTDVKYLESVRGITRRNKQIARRITVELEPEAEEETRDRLNALVAGMDLPEGVSFGGRAEGSSTNEDAQAMVFAMLLSVVFIYLLMGFLFESFVLPLSILVTIPLAMIGSVWIHLIMGKDLDILGMVGGVLLIGVVVNNGIVLVDYVNRLRTEGGMVRREAILEASELRFRPIMMTALTTICGMIPLTIGGPSAIGLSYTSFGLTLIGGMTTATLLTLLVVPVSYTLVEDAREAVVNTIARMRRGRGSSDDGVAEVDAVPAE